MTSKTLRIPHWFQGPTDSGQGGWTAARLVDIIGQPATMSIRAPIPLDTDLSVVESPLGDRWTLVDPTKTPATVIMEAERWEPEFFSTPAVAIDEAKTARGAFPISKEAHPVPHCFSCGLQSDSMGVQAGPMPDGRFATDWSAPDWSIGADGSVDGAVLWAALDCCAAWFVCNDGGTRPAFTVQFAIEVSESPKPGETYALVSWGGDEDSGWNGRKRSGASAAFTSDGTCIARSRSFWVAVD